MSDEPNHIVEDARDLLAAWRERLIADEVVVSWADEWIEYLPAGAPPEWLLDLAMYGPAQCMQRPPSEFLHVPVPSYSRAFALRVQLLQPENEAGLEAFVLWASAACMGEELALPEVQLGYQLDQLYVERERMDLALQLVKAELPALRARAGCIPERLLRWLDRNDT